MNALEYLLGPDRGLFLPPVFAGLAVAVLCGVLSVLVVLKRLAFIGHGVSHAGFGGVGLAAVLGLTSTGVAASTGYFLLIGGFCIATALGIAWLSDRKGLREDTVIGVFLVGAMAGGALLLHLKQRFAPGRTAVPSVEDVLFGSIIVVGPADAAVAWVASGAILLTLWWLRRPVLFWAFDEPAAEAFGVPAGRIRLVVMALLGVAIVVSMKLAGVVLATALLILPGAAAVRMSERLGPVFAWAVGMALVGMSAGLLLSLEFNLPPGPCIVGVLVVLFALTWPVGVAIRAKNA